jgi:acyl carrier protein
LSQEATNSDRVLSFGDFASHILAAMGVEEGDVTRATELHEIGLDSLNTFEVIVLAENLAGLVPEDRPTGPEPSAFRPIFSLGDVYDFYRELMAR